MFEDGSTITIATAILGVVLSAFALGWQFYRDLSNRPRLRVDCYIGLLTNDIHTQQLVWNIVNDGQAPIQVVSMSILTDNVNITLFMSDAPVPKMLHEAEYFLYYFPLNLLEPLKSPDAPRITAFEVADSRGKIWRASHKQVKKINCELSAQRIERA